jgi:hypothetical protein
MAYLTRDEFKSAVEIADTHDDADIDRALEAASDVIDRFCGRSFVPLDSTSSARVFDAYQTDRLQVGDVSTVSEVAEDVALNGTFSQILPSSVWQLYPLNIGQPGVDGQYTEIRIRPYSGYEFVVGVQVRVTGLWGFGAVPATVEQACLILANRYFQRPHAPFGLQEGPQSGMLAQLSDTDPDVAGLLGTLIIPGGGSGGAGVGSERWILV